MQYYHYQEETITTWGQGRTGRGKESVINIEQGAERAQALVEVVVKIETKFGVKLEFMY